jgi:hypothetical protein
MARSAFDCGQVADRLDIQVAQRGDPEPHQGACAPLARGVGFAGLGETPCSMYGARSATTPGSATDSTHRPGRPALEVP